MESELAWRTGDRGRKVLSCPRAERQGWTGLSAGSQASLLFHFLGERRRAHSPKATRPLARCPRENMTEVGNFLVSLHEGMASILMPQGTLGPYQLPAHLGGVPRQTARPTPLASEAAAVALLPPVVMGLWPLVSCVSCTPSVCWALS